MRRWWRLDLKPIKRLSWILFSRRDGRRCHVCFDKAHFFVLWLETAESPCQEKLQTGKCAVEDDIGSKAETRLNGWHIVLYPTRTELATIQARRRKKRLPASAKQLHLPLSLRRGPSSLIQSWRNAGRSSRRGRVSSVRSQLVVVRPVMRSWWIQASTRLRLDPWRRSRRHKPASSLMSFQLVLASETMIAALRYVAVSLT